MSWLLWKDLLDCVRNQVALVVLLTPLLLAAGLQFVYKPDDIRKMPIAVVAPPDCGLVRVLQRHPGLTVEPVINAETGRDRIRHRQAVLLVEVGEDYDRQILEGGRPTLDVLKDSSQPTKVVLAIEYLRSCVQQQAGQKMPARIQPKKSQGGTPQDMLFPSLVVMASLSVMVVSAANLVEEKEAGTLQQMLLSPAGSTEVWAGKLAVSSALGTLAAMSVVALRGSTLTSFWGALGLTAAASFVFAALGGVIGLLAKGPAAASSWTGLCFFALFVPVALSETSQTASRWAKFSPAYPLYDGLQRTVLAQESATSLVFNFGVLMALGALLTLVGGRLLSRFR